MSTSVPAQNVLSPERPPRSDSCAIAREPGVMPAPWSPRRTSIVSPQAAPALMDVLPLGSVVKIFTVMTCPNYAMV
eukprot:tig00020610_g11978.t1